MDLGLSDRVYVVTGASRGLGRACAEQLAAEGARLVLGGHDEDALHGVAAGLGGSERAIAVSGDLSEAGLESCLVAAAVARYGRLDGALVRVGRPPAGTVLETEDGAWRLAFEGAFLGPLRLARAVSCNVSNEGGSIVFVLSTTVREPTDGFVLSSGLWPGLAMTAKNLAEAVGPRNIRVNGILPGRIDSDRNRRPDPAPGTSTSGTTKSTSTKGTSASGTSGTGTSGKGPPEEDRRTHEATVPLRRYGEPLEFARPAVFLLSPAASYVTGTLLTVDGGMTRSL